MSQVSTSIVRVAEAFTCSGPYSSAKECVKRWPGNVEELSALLLSIGQLESGFSEHVHAGRCKRNECDKGKARSPWQLHENEFVPRVIWDSINDSDEGSTMWAAWSAAKVLSHGRARCGSLLGSISLYATGNKCTWKGAEGRVYAYKKNLSLIESLMNDGAD